MSLDRYIDDVRRYYETDIFVAAERGRAIHRFEGESATRAMRRLVTHRDADPTSLVFKCLQRGCSSVLATTIWLALQRDRSGRPAFPPPFLAACFLLTSQEAGTEPTEEVYTLRAPHTSGGDYSDVDVALPRYDLPGEALGVLNKYDPDTYTAAVIALVTAARIEELYGLSRGQAGGAEAFAASIALASVVERAGEHARALGSSALVSVLVHTLGPTSGLVREDSATLSEPNVERVALALRSHEARQQAIINARGAAATADEFSMPANATYPSESWVRDWVADVLAGQAPRTFDRPNELTTPPRHTLTQGGPVTEAPPIPTTVASQAVLQVGGVVGLLALAGAAAYWIGGFDG